MVDFAPLSTRLLRQHLDHLLEVKWQDCGWDQQVREGREEFSAEFCPMEARDALVLDLALALEPFPQDRQALELLV